MDDHKKILSLIHNNNENKFKIRDIFYNYRNKSGFRLTKKGHDLLSKITSSWFVEWPENFKILAKHYLILERYLNKPYFINKNGIWIYDPDDAVEIKLMNGDIEVICKDERLYTK